MPLGRAVELPLAVAVPTIDVVVTPDGKAVALTDELPVAITVPICDATDTPVGYAVAFTAVALSKKASEARM